MARAKVHAMTTGLETILLVDEECRSRVDFARAQSERAVGDAQEARDAELVARDRAADAALEMEIAAIGAEAAARVAERRTALDDYLRRLHAAGEKQLEAAARAFATIVSGVSS